MGLIVSASRRTDIPAFYSDWFLQRLEAGLVRVANPYRPSQVSEISLRAEDLDAIVFWTKNPKPMLAHLAKIEKKCERFYFQFTLNDYPKELEPGLPPLAERLETFAALAKCLGPERVVWRYDPIILSNRSDCDRHREVFGRLAKQLAPYTRRVIVSLMDSYQKTRKNLRPLEQSGYQFCWDAERQPATRELLRDLAGIARQHSLEIFSCAQEQDLSAYGLPAGACIDGPLIERLFGIHKAWKKDPGQRKHCLCVSSRDIGAFNSCPHGCPYCYATGNHAAACTRHDAHHPNHDQL